MLTGLKTGEHFLFVKEWSRHFQIASKFNVGRTAARRLAAAAEINLYRIAQEALNNVVKYANATSVNITLAEEDDVIALIVEDDGIGFDPEEEANRKRGLGLLGMGERAAILQGELKIESGSGKGTRIHARIPAIYQDNQPSA